MRPKQYAICPICQVSFQKRRSSSIYCCRHCAMKDLRTTKKIRDIPRKGYYFLCKVCENPFYIPQYRAKKKKTNYCSRSCLAKDKLKEYSKIYGFKKTNKPKAKYKQLKIDGKIVREHRWLMEKHLRRKLETWEHVHHINGNSMDNRIENLVVLSNSDHQKLEIKERKKFTSS